MKRIALFCLPLLALILAACSATASKAPVVPANSNASSSASGGDANSLERADQQGAVTVSLIPLNLSNPGETLDFDVSLQTHSVNLSMDLAALSTLKTDTGVTVKATAWNGPKGGHHVEGKLTFPAKQDGKLVLEGAKTLTISIQNVDAAERIFSWEITK